MNYYLCADNSVQWFTRLFTTKEKEGKEQVIEEIDVPPAINGDYLNNIFSRPTHFSNREFGNLGYVGWALSEYEYNRVKRIVGLYSSVIEYNKLLKL